MSSTKPLSYASAVTGKRPDQQPRTIDPALSQSHTIPQPSHEHQAASFPAARPPPQPQSVRQQAHIPSTASPEQHLYVLTLATTPSLSRPLDALREKHFPARLNRTPAHLTLFHALPHSRLPTITTILSALSQHTTPFTIRTGSPFRLRRGVGINVGKGAQEAKQLHAELREAWREFLSEQDAGGWRAHWTVQNKVDEEEEAARAFEEVRTGFAGAEGRATGVALWRYERGWWKFEREWRFEGQDVEGR